MNRSFILAILLCYYTCLCSQRPSSSSWLTVNIPVSFSARGQWLNDAGYRTLGETKVPFQFFYRTGIRHVFNDNINMAAGIAFFFTRTSFNKLNDEFGKEFRTWQEINTIVQITKRLQWISRFRNEQRFFERTAVKDAFIAFRFRGRTSLQYKISPKLSVLISEEYMNRIVKKNFAFDQNRLSAGLVIQAGKSFQLQPGFMWLKWPESSQRVLQLTFQKSFSNHKK